MQVLTIDTVVDYNNSKPVYANDTDACMDLKASLPVNELTIPAHQTEVIGSGVKCSIPENHVMMMFVRSSVGIKKGLVLANGTGIIDAGYRDEIKMALHNTTDHDVIIKDGERLCQFLILERPKLTLNFVKDDDSFNEGNRGGGIGSTGEQ